MSFKPEPPLVDKTVLSLPPVEFVQVMLKHEVKQMLMAPGKDKCGHDNYLPNSFGDEAIASEHINHFGKLSFEMANKLFMSHR